MRGLGLACCLLVLAGCGAGDAGRIAGAALGPLTGRAAPAAEGAAPRVITREDLEAAGRPVVRLRLVDNPRPTLFYAATRNRDVTGYTTPLREYLGLTGTKIVATRALGADLLRATSSPDDPLVDPTPPDDWPEGVIRRYEWPGEGPAGRSETYSCRFVRGEETTIAILGREHRGVLFSESCEGEAGRFENLHFADAGSGFVWRSIQWTGPRQGLVDIEIIVPGP